MRLRSRTVRSLIVGLLASLCAVGASPPASADPILLPTFELFSAALAVDGYDLAHLPDGTLAVVWSETTDEQDGAVYFTTRGPGDETFAPAELLSSGLAYDPQVVVDTQGGVSVAWILSRTERNVQATYLEPEATEWTTPEIVTSHSALTFELVVDAHDSVAALSLHAVTEIEPPSTTYRIDANVRLAGAGWSGPQVVAEETAQEIADLGAVASAEGTITAVWTQGTGLESRVHAARADTAPEVASEFVAHPVSAAAVGAGAPDLAMAPNGAAVVSFAQREALTTRQVAVVATVDPEGVVTGLETVSSASDEVLDTEVVVDRAGRATVLAATGNGEGPTASYGIVAATQSADDSVFSSRSLAIDTTVLTAIGVGLGPDGALSATWQRGRRGDPICAIQFVHRDPLGDVATPAELTPPNDPDTTADDVCAHDPAIAVDAAGDVTVIWGIDDVVGPQLDVTVPATATVGSAIEVRASALDDWSGPASIAWSFGDGVTSLEASTSHVYAAAGTYQVSVTATDVVGNTSRQTRTVVVGSPPTPAPPPAPPGDSAPAPGDTVAPALSRARVVPRTRLIQVRSRLRLTISEPATLSGVVQRKRDGRWRVIATKRWSVAAGANEKTFFSKAQGMRLRPGTYRLRLSATDPAGNASATTTLRFTVAPRSSRQVESRSH